LSWDPTIYLGFGQERERPALDLLGRIAAPHPADVVDLGCGAGNITAMMRRRWPAADILGVDGSAEMLARAAATVPGCRFAQGDIATWRPERPVDVLYSNAALHWLADHAGLFPRLLGDVAPGGTFAVQMPAMHEMPLRRLQYDVAASGPWAKVLAGIGSAPPILEAGAYWDILRPHCAALDIWETTYLHALTGPDPVAAWARGSSLRPFLDALPPDLRPGFIAAYADAVRPAYPPRADGTTLLPFRRLFLVAAR
jgi:trans-aconitate 2-methyltransferase